MNFKKIATTIELLAITSVVSVGFSAWSIVETTFPTVTATIETENVIDNNTFITIKNMTFSDFYYELDENKNVTKYGFFQDNVFDTSKLNNTCILEVEVEVNLNMCSDYITNNVYQFDFGLNCSKNMARNNFVQQASSITLEVASSFTDLDLSNKISKIADPIQQNSYTREDRAIVSLTDTQEANSTMSLYLTYSLVIPDATFTLYIKNYVEKGNGGVPFKLTTSLEEGVVA